MSGNERGADRKPLGFCHIGCNARVGVRSLVYGSGYGCSHDWVLWLRAPHYGGQLRCLE